MAGMEPGHILDALINHVTLPPRLPFKDDGDGGATDRALAQRLEKHSRAFRSNSDTQYYHQWCIICRALDHFVTLHNSSGHLSKDTLKNAFIDISNSDGDILIVHIATQNAGLIIRKGNSDEFIFEAFEASPRAANVLAAGNALQWDFPSHAVAIPSETFDDPGFQEYTAEFLEKASIDCQRLRSDDRKSRLPRLRESRYCKPCINRPVAHGFIGSQWLCTSYVDHAKAGAR